MKRFTGILLIFQIFTLAGYAQELWSLDDCIEHAMENNIQLKRQVLLSESARNNFRNSLISVLPNITAFANHDFNSGRALNYDTYQWENREFEQGNLGVESRLNIFSGFQNYNNIKQHRFMLMSRLEETERTMNDISLNISAAYFEILLDMELVEIAEKQLEISTLELDAARSNFSLGNISKGGVLEMESQAAADEYQLTLERNNLSQSYLNLFQILQLEPGEDFQIRRPEAIEINESAILNTVVNIYDEAQIKLPQVRGAEYFLKSRESELAMVRGQQSPRLALRGLFYSRYSELAVDPFNGEDYLYSTQIKDNQYRQLGVSLIIPVFDGWNVRSRISNAKISVMDASYQLDETRQNLFFEIHQMHNKAKNAYNSYNSAVKAVTYALEASEYAREQFRMGMINFVDYQHAQTSLFQAQSNMVQAKYEFYLRSMILDFYIGEPLGLE